MVNIKVAAYVRPNEADLSVGRETSTKEDIRTHLKAIGL